MAEGSGPEFHGGNQFGRNPRGHSHGAFSNADKPQSRPNGRPKGKPQGGLDSALKNSGKNGIGIGAGGNLGMRPDGLSNSFGGNNDLLAGLRNIDDPGAKKNGDDGDSGMQSGLPDPDKERGKNPDNQNGMGHGGMPEMGPGSPKVGKGLGQKAGKLAAKAGGLGKKVTGVVTGGVLKFGNKVGIRMSKKGAGRVAHAIMYSFLGVMLIAGAYNYQQSQIVKDGYNICSTQNTGDETYAGTTSGDSGSMGSWTQSGSTEYKNAKAVAQNLRGLGFSGVAIAGIMGNMAHESGFKTGALNGSGDGGKGLIQWTGKRRAELESFAKEKGLDSGSLKLQLMMLDRDLKKKDFWVSAYKPISPKILSHASSPKDAALRFYLSQFEAGGGWSHDPDGTAGKREANAQEAYSLFHLSGIKGNDSKLNSLLGGDNATVANGNSALAEKANNLLCNNKNQGPATAGNWGWPFANFDPKKDISSGFGAVGGRSNWHDGIDIGTATNTGDVLAIHGGKVTDIGCTTKAPDQSQIGYYIIVQSPDGYSEIYQEFAFTQHEGDKVTKVKVGDNVKTGQVITKVSPSTLGCTHIHIGVFKGSGKQLWSTGEHYYNQPGHGWLDPVSMIQSQKEKQNNN